MAQDRIAKSPTESFEEAIRNHSLKTSIRIAFMIFLVILLYLGWSEALDKKKDFSDLIKANEAFVVKSLKLGDYVSIQLFLNSLIGSDDVLSVGIRKKDSSSWLVRAKSKLSFVDNKSWLIIGKGIVFSHLIQLKDFDGTGWPLTYQLKIPYSLALFPLLISLLLSILVFIVLNKQFYLNSKHFTLPLNSLARDIAKMRSNSLRTLDLKYYSAAPKFTETNSIVRELVRLLDVIEEQQESLQQIEVLRALNIQSRQVAHDIQSPLGALKAARITYQKNQILAEKVMEKAIKRIGDIIQDLQKEQAASPKADLVALDQVISEIILEKELEHQGTIFTFKSFASADKTLVTFDKSVLFRILSNLVNNAVEAKRVGADLSISFTLVTKDSHLLLAITDNGAGMPESVRNKVFELGFTSGKESGLGMGLAHARKTMEFYGGSIRIESNVNLGTTIELKFPNLPFIKILVDFQNRVTATFLYSRAAKALPHFKCENVNHLKNEESSLRVCSQEVSLDRLILPWWARKGNDPTEGNETIPRPWETS